jgi:hypothetical protein
MGQITSVIFFGNMQGHRAGHREPLTKGQGKGWCIEGGYQALVR